MHSPSEHLLKDYDFSNVTFTTWHEMEDNLLIKKFDEMGPKRYNISQYLIEHSIEEIILRYLYLRDINEYTLMINNIFPPHTISRQSNLIASCQTNFTSGLNHESSANVDSIDETETAKYNTEYICKNNDPEIHTEVHSEVNTNASSSCSQIFNSQVEKHLEPISSHTPTNNTIHLNYSYNSQDLSSTCLNNYSTIDIFPRCVLPRIQTETH